MDSRVHAWLQWGTRTRGWVDATRREYARVATSWLDWCTDTGTRADRAGADSILVWLDTIHPSPAAHRHAVTALVAWYDWRSPQRNPARLVPRPRVRRGVPRSLSREQATAFLASAETHGRMWHLYVAMLLYAGLRRAEACAVQWGDVEGTDAWLRIEGKGGWIRVVPIHPELRRLIVRWRSQGASAVWMFPGRYGHVSLSSAQKHVRAILDHAGLPQATTHWGRHTYATVALEESGDIAAVRDALGHQSLSSTSIYTQARPARVAEVVAMIDYDA